MAAPRQRRRLLWLLRLLLLLPLLRLHAPWRRRACACKCGEVTPRVDPTVTCGNRTIHLLCPVATVATIAIIVPAAIPSDLIRYCLRIYALGVPVSRVERT